MINGQKVIAVVKWWMYIDWQEEMCAAGLQCTNDNEDVN